MGYTHYMAYAPEDEQFKKAWPDILTDARLIVDHVTNELGIEIAGGVGEGEPVIGGEGPPSMPVLSGTIWLNGAGPREPEHEDLAHETLLIDPHPGAARKMDQLRAKGFVWEFCKTARKPYDVAVGAILIRCHQHAPEAFVFDSDGGWLDGAWDDPRAVVVKLFGTDELKVSLEKADSTNGPPCVRGARA
jgi:hypothetical protein